MNDTVWVVEYQYIGEWFYGGLYHSRRGARAVIRQSTRKRGRSRIVQYRRVDEKKGGRKRGR